MYWSGRILLRLNTLRVSLHFRLVVYRCSIEGVSDTNKFMYMKDISLAHSLTLLLSRFFWGACIASQSSWPTWDSPRHLCPYSETTWNGREVSHNFEMWSQLWLTLKFGHMLSHDFEVWSHVITWLWSVVTCYHMTLKFGHMLSHDFEVWSRYHMTLKFGHMLSHDFEVWSYDWSVIN